MIHHDEPLFVAFLESIKLRITIKQIQWSFNYTIHGGKFDVFDCCVSWIALVDDLSCVPARYTGPCALINLILYSRGGARSV
jgi:hypothetical protein